MVRCKAAMDCDGRTFDEVMHQWASEHSDEEDGAEAEGIDDVVFSVPVSHALLLVSGAWQSHAFPVSSNGHTRGATGLKLVRSLWDFEADWQAHAPRLKMEDGGTDLMDERNITKLADLLRASHSTIAKLSDLAMLPFPCAQLLTDIEKPSVALTFGTTGWCKISHFAADMCSKRNTCCSAWYLLAC